MFIGKYEIFGVPYFAIYYKNRKGYKKWVEDTFSPNVENIELLDFKIKGNNYKEKRYSLEDIAIDWVYQFSTLCWSYSELAEIENWFYKNAKRYGLLEEFRVNGVC